jgi:hypothetical protein
MTCSRLQRQFKRNQPLSSVLWLALFAVQERPFTSQNYLLARNLRLNNFWYPLKKKGTFIRSQFVSESGAVDALSQTIVQPLHESKPPPY